MHRSAALGCAAVLACSSHDAQPPSDASLELRFSIDAPVGGEQYECSGFDASSLAGRWIRSIAWKAPPAGAVALHHATLYAVPQDYPAGPVTCDTMPTSWTMHIWAPGGTPLSLLNDVGIALPAATRRLVVQTHALRSSSGPPATASATIDSTGSAPVHPAAWLPAYGAVPAIRPHMQEHTATICSAAAPMHVFTAWPHMHLLGTAFQGAIVRSGGVRTVVVDVPSYSFGEQRTYPIDQDLAAGDGFESDCTWFNPTDQYVLPGASTHDEMCGAGLIVWPAQTAAWQGSCR